MVQGHTLAVMAWKAIESTPAHQRSDIATIWDGNIDITMNGRTPITGELPDISQDHRITQIADTTDTEETCPTADTTAVGNTDKMT
jgi:hypothetical protein